MQLDQPNFEFTEAGDNSVFRYTFPEADEYSFILVDRNLNGDEYLVGLNEEYDGNTGMQISIAGKEGLSSDTEEYISSNLHVNLKTEGKLTTLQNTLLKTWNSAEGYEKINNPSLKEFGSELFYLFYKRYLDLISQEITSDTNSFSFGYDIKEKPTKIFLDSELFGGTPSSRAFYLEPPKRSGWFGILDKIRPETSGEEPRCENAIEFSDLALKINEQAELFSGDDRINADKERIFIPPFYQIFDKSTKALIEAVIKATIRIYISDTMLRGMATFSTFSAKFPKNYDDVLAAYIAENLKLGLMEEGRSFFGKNDDSYYLEFMEQVVQSFGNKIDASLVKPTPPEQDAINFLNKEQVDLSDKCKKLTKIMKLEFLRRDDIQSASSVIAQRYIKEELENTSQIFRETITGGATDVDTEFVTNEKWINATSNGNLSKLIDVVGTVTENSSNLIDYYIPGGKTSSFEDPESYIPFVLERYMLIEDYDEQEAKEKNLPSSVTARPKRLFGVVGVSDWNTYLAAISDPASAVFIDLSGKKIEDLWKSWKFGVRISILPPSSGVASTTGFIIGTGAPSTSDPGPTPWALKFEQMASTISLEECQRQKAFRIGNTESPKIPLFPLVSHEEIVENVAISPISGEGTITELFEQNQRCMLENFFDSPQYKSIFKYSLSFSRILSMMAIYTINGFLPSLGVAEALNPIYLGPNRGLKTWDRSPFKLTRDHARTMFEALYNSQNPNYRDRKHLDMSSNYKMIKRGKTKFPNLDDGLKWWQRRLQRNRPFDKHGQPSEYKKEGGSKDTVSIGSGTSGGASLGGSAAPSISASASALILPDLQILDEFEKYEKLILEMENTIIDQILAGATSIGDFSAEPYEVDDGKGSGLSTETKYRVPRRKVRYMTEFFGRSVKSVNQSADLYASAVGSIRGYPGPIEIVIPDFVDEESSDSLGKIVVKLLSQDIIPTIENYIIELTELNGSDLLNDYTDIITYFEEIQKEMETLRDAYTDLSDLFEEYHEIFTEYLRFEEGYPTDLLSPSEYDNEFENIEENVESILVGPLKDSFLAADTFFEDIGKTIVLI